MVQITKCSIYLRSTLQIFFLFGNTVSISQQLTVKIQQWRLVVSHHCRGILTLNECIKRVYLERHVLPYPLYLIKIVDMKVFCSNTPEMILFKNRLLRLKEFSYVAAFMVTTLLYHLVENCPNLYLSIGAIKMQQSINLF